ncbi:MAG: ATP-binding protein [Propionibacteriaceae bacterium]|jgi:predicted AAA+ superfamily ATPase|nr:ATP-binding protein [Propionibacteriaceae bacterium]
MEIRRKVEDELLAWKKRPSRQPLLLLGARQVGKTFTAHHFGRQHFAKLVTANFQADLARLRPLFDASLEPDRIIEDLGYLTETAITAQDTLIIFDEIQLCPPALTALKYFAERAPQYAIIATGSLFGVSIHREEHYTFPVGKVDTLQMHPLDFEEYLWAQGMELHAEGIRRAVERCERFAAHDDMVRQVRRYMMTGGLPRVVTTYIETKDWSETRRVQRDLALLYAADMALYADPVDSVRTRAIWESAPRQLARDTSRKFKLADMKSGARFHQYDAGFAWLEAAGLVQRHYQAEVPFAPLRARDDGTFFKVYLFDTGILATQLGMSAQVFCSDQGYTRIASSFCGGIAENYVKQALTCAGLNSMYWSSGNAAEIDFLTVDDTMVVVPMEVKSADTIRSRSLDSYRQHYHPPRAIRLSMKNVGQEDGLVSLPLYSAFCLPDVLRSR